jgi:hypothetical protein
MLRGTGLPIEGLPQTPLLRWMSLGSVPEEHSLWGRESDRPQGCYLPSSQVFVQGLGLLARRTDLSQSKHMLPTHESTSLVNLATCS